VSEQWIKSERPDGHRSLWFKARVWFVMGPAGDEVVNMRQPDHTQAHYFHVGEMGYKMRSYGCPEPTAADLAWLRGGG
jgi:hypothetical protein